MSVQRTHTFTYPHTHTHTHTRVHTRVHTPTHSPARANVHIIERQRGLYFFFEINKWYNIHLLTWSCILFFSTNYLHNFLWSKLRTVHTAYMLCTFQKEMRSKLQYPLHMKILTYRYMCVCNEKCYLWNNKLNSCCFSKAPEGVFNFWRLKADYPRRCVDITCNSDFSCSISLFWRGCQHKNIKVPVHSYLYGLYWKKMYFFLGNQCKLGVNAVKTERFVGFNLGHEREWPHKYSWDRHVTSDPKQQQWRTRATAMKKWYVKCR